MSDPVYQVGPGARIKKGDVPALVASMQALTKRLHRPPLPSDIEQAARSPRSAWHAYLEWDDGIAAVEYRVVQIREILRGIDVVMEDRGGVAVRAFVPMVEEGGGYVSTAWAFNERPDYVQIMVNRARQDARETYEKYGALISTAEFQPAAEWVEAARKLAASA